MILVADASALIALATCDSLALLEAIFGKVLVPEAVFSEVTASGKPQSVRLQSYLYGKVHAVDMRYFVYLDAFADAGETQAMLLYKEVAADYLLIDDRRGRKVAKINQIKTVGSLGVLLQANRHGASVTPNHESACASRFPLLIPPPQAGEGEHESLRDFHGKRIGLVPRVAPLIEQIAASPVFMSESLIQTVLEMAGES